MNSEMKLRNLDEIFEIDKETSIQKTRKRLRECMDDVFAEFLDANVLSAKDVYEIILDSVEAQQQYYQSQAALNEEFINYLKGLSFET
jgi:hypothetical protein